MAQTPSADVIVTKDNVKIDAVIKEIDETTVKYKRFSNPNGPQYTIKKEEVVTILYANGEVDAIRKPSGEALSPPVNQSVRPSMLTYARDVQGKSTPDLRKLFKEEQRAKGAGVFWGTFFGSAALIGTIVGFVQLADAKDTALNSHAVKYGHASYDEELSDYRALAIGTVVTSTVVGGGLSFLIYRTASKRARRVHIIRNELSRRGETVSLRLTPTLNSGLRTVSLGVSARF
ncbi:hypothetical protein [Dyadobacter fermentans]|uniref:hypothetical protein n=1 Tax=Dyadobacter fermentans TaxID=94254 RepID=UPI00019B5803|nr:hypothetical protein [Dyadobacter fermentans]